MRFLLLSQYYWPEIGAVAVRLGAMARALVNAGHEVEVVTGMPNYPSGRVFDGYRGRLFSTERQDSVTIHRCWLHAAMGTGAHRLANYASFMVTALPGLARARRPDVLFIESPPLFVAVPGLLTARLRGCVTVLNIADLWPDAVVDLGIMREGPAIGAARRLEAWAYRRAAFVNAVTEGIRSDLIERKGVPTEKLTFLPNGVDLGLMRPLSPATRLRDELAISDGHAVIVYAGTLGVAQGLDSALDAAALTRDVACYLFIGDGSERPRLEAAARERGLDNVRFVASRPVEEIPSYYSIATAGLVSLRDFALADGARPSKMFPIMGCGKPVLYVGSGEGARLVQATGCGIVTPPGDGVALARAVRDLLAAPAQAVAMSERGRAYVEANLSWDALIQGWLIDLECRMGAPGFGRVPAEPTARSARG